MAAAPGRAMRHTRSSFLRGASLTAIARVTVQLMRAIRLWRLANVTLTRLVNHPVAPALKRVKAHHVPWDMSLFTAKVDDLLPMVELWRRCHPWKWVHEPTGPMWPPEEQDAEALTIERDHLISLLRDTRPGRITWDFNFLRGILAYVVVPLAVALATVFPEIGLHLSGVLEPVKDSWGADTSRECKPPGAGETIPLDVPTGALCRSSVRGCMRPGLAPTAPCGVQCSVNTEQPAQQE